MRYGKEPWGDVHILPCMSSPMFVEKKKEKKKSRRVLKKKTMGKMPLKFVSFSVKTKLFDENFISFPYTDKFIRLTPISIILATLFFCIIFFFFFFRRCPKKIKKKKGFEKRKPVFL